jgi:hypothetical protein
VRGHRLEPGADPGILRQRERALEVPQPRDHVPRHVADLPHRLFELGLVRIPPQRFRALGGATVRGDRLVVRVEALGLGARFAGERQAALVLAGLDVVVRELLHRARDAGLAPFETLRGPQVQPAAPNGIHLLVEDLADLVVGERE